MSGLGEKTTEPQDGDQVLPDLDRVQTVVDRFYHFADLSTFLGRCIPYVESVEFDEDYDRELHVVIGLRQPIEDPSDSTIEGVREELNELSEIMCRKWNLPVIVLSARLN